jgi:hypothetical protein
MKYAHQHIWGTPWETKPVALTFGKSIHKAAETYYRNLRETGEIIPVAQVIATFENVFNTEIDKTDIEIALKKGQTAESIREQGIELLKLFHADIRPQKIVAVEFSFSVKIPDLINGNGHLEIKLEGVFDLIESDLDGNYAVVELKTSSQRYSSLKLEYDVQATVYSYSMSQMKVATSENSCLVRYDVLLKLKKPAFEHYFVARTQSDHDRLIHLINQILKAIECRIFFRNTSWA